MSKKTKKVKALRNPAPFENTAGDKRFAVYTTARMLSNQTPYIVKGGSARAVYARFTERWHDEPLKVAEVYLTVMGQWREKDGGDSWVIGSNEKGH